MVANMKIQYLQHVPFENLGSIATWAAEKNVSVNCTHLYNDELLPDIGDFDWLIVMGGPMNIYEYDKYPWFKDEKVLIREAIRHNKTVLGVCLGAQLIADVLGAKVYANGQKEIGWWPIKPASTMPSQTLRAIFGEELEVMHWHGDTFSIPAGAVHLATSEACRNQGFIYQDRVIALQFHLETTEASLKRLISNCQDEIVTAPYIQNASEMLAHAARFRKINAVMGNLLDYLQTLPQ